MNLTDIRKAVNESAYSGWTGDDYTDGMMYIARQLLPYIEQLEQENAELKACVDELRFTINKLEK
jgi:hypothetical protein